MSILFEHIGQLVTVDSERSTAENPLGIIENASLFVENGAIVWCGEAQESEPFRVRASEVVDVQGQVILPGFVDSHTHPVFAGDRADEFEQRLRGDSYLEIAKRGGGISKTVQATREASEETLYHLTEKRLETMLSFGATTVEVKSGYGLDWATEKKSLRVLARLKSERSQSLCVTYMGAHDIPAEFKQNPDAYVAEVCEVQLPKVAERGLADFCDVFCETGYFTVAQSRKILMRAKALGLGLKIHAEEFTDIGGSVLAGELGAASADHLLNVSPEGIESLRCGGTVATLLPGTAFYLQMKDYAPARALLEAGVSVALATDFNPGSCMSENIQLVMVLACLQMGMTPVEAIRGVTIEGARALRLDNDRGSLTVEKRADLLVFAMDSYNELLYHYGVNHLRYVYIEGKQVWSAV